jgi:nitrile hydratase
MILGIPPAWYKSREYRARVVREPRAVLEEFGVSLPADTEIRVVDSTADLRYLVIPERPSGTDHLGEEALAEIISRDSMIGTGLVSPSR